MVRFNDRRSRSLFQRLRLCCARPLSRPRRSASLCPRLVTPMNGGKPNEPLRDPGTNLRVHRSEDILKGDQEILIDHCGSIYQMRVTMGDKLMLNKPQPQCPPAHRHTASIRE